ncbi:unnamed protein product [Boreogadus saida]
MWAISELGRPSGPVMITQVIGGRRSVPPSTVECPCTRAFILLADLKPVVGLRRSTPFIQADTENNTNRVL